MIIVEKYGRDVEVSDRLNNQGGGHYPFLVLGIVDAPDAPGMRIALDCWGDPVELHDTSAYAVGVARLGEQPAAATA